MRYYYQWLANNSEAFYDETIKVFNTFMDETQNLSSFFISNQYVSSCMGAGKFYPIYIHYQQSSLSLTGKTIITELSPINTFKPGNVSVAVTTVNKITSQLLAAYTFTVRHMSK